MGELRPVLTASPSTSTVPATARRGCERSINVSMKYKSMSKDSVDENLGFPIAIASRGPLGFATKLLQFIASGLVILVVHTYILRSFKEVISIKNSKFDSWIEWTCNFITTAWTCPSQLRSKCIMVDLEQIMGLLNNAIHAWVDVNQVNNYCQENWVNNCEKQEIKNGLIQQPPSITR